MNAASCRVASYVMCVDIAATLPYTSELLLALFHVLSLPGAGLKLYRRYNMRYSASPLSGFHQPESIRYFLKLLFSLLIKGPKVTVTQMRSASLRKNAFKQITKLL